MKELKTKWKIFGIICIISLLVVGIYYGYTYGKDYTQNLLKQKYDEGYKQGIIDLVIEINKNGAIPVITENETKIMTIKEICSQ